MSQKAVALRWYFGAMKAYKLQTTKTVFASIASSLLVDAAIPYCMAIIFDKFGKSPSLSELRDPVIWLLASLLGVYVAAPYRLWNRWLLEVNGYEYLTNKINQAVEDSPDLAARLPAGSAIGSTEKFLDTWGMFLYTTTEQLVMFVVGMGGLVWLLSIRAPAALLVVVFVIILVLVVARKAADRVSIAWGDRTKGDTRVLEVFDGLFSSSSMLWLVRTLTGARRLVTAKRTKAGLKYARAITVYHLFMYGIGTSLKVVAVIGGAFMVVLGTISVGTVSLFLVYAFSLSERLYGVFGVGEIFGNAATESRPLLEALENNVQKPPLPLEQNHTLAFKGRVKVEYPPTPPLEEGGELAVGDPGEVVILSDIILWPGIWLFMGLNGCGKTTRLKIIAGCQAYTAGSVTMGGHEIGDHDVRENVFFGRQDFDKLAVTVKDLFGENADIGPRRHALACVGYEDVPLGRLLSGLSGGQRRRVFLARLLYAVFTRDKSRLGVLCLDEPTNDLDEKSVDRFLQELVKLSEEDPLLIVAIATHHREMKEIVDNPDERVITA